MAQRRTTCALTVFVFVVAGLLLRGQSGDGERFTPTLLQNRYGISVRNGQLAGAGAQVLKTAIAQSRFVLLGETHGLAETAGFWGGVCRAAGPQGFHTMAIEEGPLMAAELERWVRQPGGEAKLAAFQKQYGESINIYGTREEFAALEQCAASVSGGELRLWGLNQEALGAGGFILRKVLDTRPGGEAGDAMRRLIQRNDDANAKADQTGKMSDLFMLSADDKELSAGAASLEKDGSPLARSMFASLIESHEINRAWPRDGGRRRRLMEALFKADYAEAARSGGAPPKVLLKFGAFHVYRGLNPVGESALGSYVAELADGQGARSLHICLMAVKGTMPMYTGIGRPPRTRAFNLTDDPRSRYLQPMMDNLIAGEWTMFDLRPLRQTIKAGSGTVSAEMERLVLGMDLLVMVPEGSPSTPFESGR